MAFQRTKRLTKRERKALAPPRPDPPAVPRPIGKGENEHIHCIACGRHLDPTEFDAPERSQWIRCAHGGAFAACTGCAPQAQSLLDEHDKSGQPVKAASAWH